MSNKKLLMTMQNKRSRLFTELYHHLPLTMPKIIKLYNPNGENIFQDKLKANIAKEFLRSGKIKIIIPTYKEHQFGAVYHVLDYVAKLAGKENILVIDADSKDQTYVNVKEQGYDIVKQHNIEKCLDLKRMSHDFGVDLPLRRGKGKTLFLAAIYQDVLNLHQQHAIEFNLFSDADITNPNKFNHAMYLAWVASHYAEGKLLEVKAAQHNRNNQSVMNTIALLQTTNPTIHEYYKIISEMIWPLTGQIMRSSKFFSSTPNTLGYSTEMTINFACVDFMKTWKMKLAQVETATKCMDFTNNLIKEAAMMIGISTTMYAINEKIFKHKIQLIDMKPHHFRRLNDYLTLLENNAKEGFVASVINSASKPNEIIRIKLDRMLPSSEYLIHHGYVNMDKMAPLIKAKKKFR
jgi:hypothetical protein